MVRALSLWGAKNAIFLPRLRDSKALTGSQVLLQSRCAADFFLSLAIDLYLFVRPLSL